jgi:hypothetical protein
VTVAFGFTDKAWPVVELGLGDVRTDLATTGVWDTSEWDDPTALWAGTEPSWLDITDKTHDIIFTLGRARATDLFDIGTATLIVSNEDGWADPIPPDDDPARLTLRAGRQLRVGVYDVDTDTTTWKWRGYIDAAWPRYDASLHDIAEVNAVCALGEVGRVNLVELVTPVGTSELANTRVIRILDAAKWPNAKRNIPVSGVTMLATTLGDSTANMLRIVADSVGGAIFGDTLGRVVLRGRDWQVWQTGDPTDATIGNIDPGDVAPVSWLPSNQRVDVITQVQLARNSDAAPTVWDDDEGQALYGVEPFQALDLVCSASAQLERLALRLFRTRGYTTTPRIDAVHMDAATSDDALNLLVAVDPFLPSRYSCNLELERGQVFDRDMLVTGVRHHMAPDVWEADINLDLAEPWEAVGGDWDYAYWDRNVWSEAV